MKKVILAIALVALTGSIASKVYASSNGVKMELRDDEKKKKKKKKGCCSGTEQKKCCSGSTSKSTTCGDKH
jgi:hypothetical protein